MWGKADLGHTANGGAVSAREVAAATCGHDVAVYARVRSTPGQSASFLSPLGRRLMSAFSARASHEELTQ
jgi:hypothetical protein